MQGCQVCNIPAIYDLQFYSFICRLMSGIYIHCSNILQSTCKLLYIKYGNKNNIIHRYKVVYYFLLYMHSHSYNTVVLLMITGISNSLHLNITTTRKNT